MVLPRLALVVALVVSAAGCQGSTGGTKTASGQTVPTAQWVGDLCSGISEWQAALQDVPDATNNPDLAKLKSAMVSFLDALVRNTDKLVAKIRAAGIPNIPSGDQAARDFQAAFQAMETSFRNAKSTIDGTPTNDQAKFAAGLTQVGAVLQGSIDNAEKAFGSISTKYPEVGKAAKEAASCKTSGSG